MADTKLIGHDYQTPGTLAKVTGQAKYAEDFRAEGMLFCKLLLSPMPHARVRNIDAREALRMPGVRGLLTADDLPPLPEPPAPLDAAPSPYPSLKLEMALTNEPVYEGEPILAVAADDELTAANAIEKIVVDLEPLPFCVDPIQSLHPDGPNARLEGNVYIGPRVVPDTVSTLKWTLEDWREVEAGRLPFRDGTNTWQIGDVEEGFKEAALIIDETVQRQANPHHPLEPRSAMAYWQNGKLYLYVSTQSIAQTVYPTAEFVGLDPSQFVLISEYCGGGFGSKVRGCPTNAIPALLSKKTGRPVMMRITSEEEYYIGRGRPGLHARAKIGFRKDGRIAAMDLFIVQDNGPYDRSPGGGRNFDARLCGLVASTNYQPLTMRVRTTEVLTNTPPRDTQRAPGGEQAVAMFEPLISMAARKLGIDDVEIRKINAPTTGSAFGPANPKGVRQTLTSAFAREALDKGAALFNWEERKHRSGQRRGSKVTGVAAVLSNFAGGGIGYDGLLTIRPDGKLYIHQGVGNLGTHSVHDSARAAPEVLGMPWDRCEVVWGDTSKHLPWSSTQSGSNSLHAHTRANHAAAMDAKEKLQQIAAKDLGGSPDDYDVGNARVFRKGSPSRGMSFAQAATRAIELGGAYDGHKLPEDIHKMTTTSAAALAGIGLVGVAKDNYGRKGTTRTFVAAFIELEVDVETGEYKLLDYLGVVDVGIVAHPRALGAQIHGGAVQGFGHARTQKWTYDQQYGVALGKRFHHMRPPSILDIPFEREMQWAAVGIPDPQTPVGAKGVGEAVLGAGLAAVKCGLAAAIGDDYMRRTPVTIDVILASLDAGKRVDAGLLTHV